MKKIFLFLAIATFFVACSKTPDVSSTTFVTSDVQVSKSVVTDSLNEFGNPVIETTLYYPEYAIIKPTWGQSFSWAFKSGYTGWFILGLFSLFIAAYVLYRVVRDEPLLVIGTFRIDPMANVKGGNTIAYILFACLAVALGSFGGQPGAIKWNNNKSIEKAHYESVIKETGSTQVLWDSLQTGNKIVGANIK